MARQHHYRRRTREPADLNMTTFLNLMVALIPFLLVTAVFSRISIVELNLPSTANTAPSEPAFRLEVIVREAGLELTNGSALIAVIPKRDGDYDLGRLSQLVMSLKRDNPDANQASVLRCTKERGLSTGSSRSFEKRLDVLECHHSVRGV